MRTLLCFILVSLSACKSEPKPETTVPNPAPSHRIAPTEERPVPEMIVYPKLATTLYPPAFAVVAAEGHAPAPFVEGNSKEGLESAFTQGVRHAEVDVVLTSDGALVTAGSRNARGTCKRVDERPAAALEKCVNAAGHRLLTLHEVLGMEFDYVFVDLEPALHRDPTREGQVIDAVVSAARSSARKTRHVVAILPTISPGAAAVLSAADVTPGVKGYPKSKAAVMDIVQKARDAGFVVVSANARHVTPEVIRASAEIGVWHLPWTRPGTDLEELRVIAEAGAGGVITRDYGATVAEVAKSARRLPVEP